MVGNIQTTIKWWLDYMPDVSVGGQTDQSWVVRLQTGSKWWYPHAPGIGGGGETNRKWIIV